MAPTALLSVSNKNGLVPLAKALITAHGFQLLSSGGTAKLLEQEGIEVTRVADYTGSPEILEGRVKTLHPRIHGGILAKRNNPSHKSDLEKNKIYEIDLVVVNLYPFKETVEDPNVKFETAIEQIDIGGPAMVRAAAKNHSHVVVLTRPDQYQLFLQSLEVNQVTPELRKQFALEAFQHTASYDIAISNWMDKQSSAKESPWLQAINIKQQLRYGENPHQSACWYSSSTQGWGGAKQLQGKELSTNNLLDLEAALSTVREFGFGSSGKNPAKQNAAVVVKHTNPCGVATNDSKSIAMTRALDGDRTSAFGGIVAMNFDVDAPTANELTSLFLECVVAPDFNKEALEILSKKKNLRLLQLSPSAIDKAERNNIRSILGGLLIQEQDDEIIDSTHWELKTKRSPTSQEALDLSFAWKVVRHVRSNAIVIASNNQTIGIGAGQMNRVGSAEIALQSAGEKSNGGVLASDGFFPFDDTVKLAGKHGIKAIIQPGGSIRDQSSIEACDELGISMVFTGKRHFLH